MALARSQRLLELLFLVDVESDAAEMTRNPGFVPDQAAAGANPLPGFVPAADPEGNVEIAAGLGDSRDRPVRPFAVLRFEQGKKQLVGYGLFAARRRTGFAWHRTTPASAWKGRDPRFRRRIPRSGVENALLTDRVMPVTPELSLPFAGLRQLDPASCGADRSYTRLTSEKPRGPQTLVADLQFRAQST